MLASLERVAPTHLYTDRNSSCSDREVLHPSDFIEERACILADETGAGRCSDRFSEID